VANTVFKLLQGAEESRASKYLKDKKWTFLGITITNMDIYNTHHTKSKNNDMLIRPMMWCPFPLYQTKLIFGCGVCVNIQFPCGWLVFWKCL